MDVFREMERRIDERVRTLFGSSRPGAQGRDLLELQHAILREIGERVQHTSRGRRVFPYTTIELLVAAAPERQAAIEAIFLEGRALEQEVRQHLEREGCEIPGELTLVITVVAAPALELGGREFHLRFERTPVTSSGTIPAVSSAKPPGVSITILHGEAEAPVWQSEKGRLNLGRRAEILDDRRRLVRRNDVWFVDTGTPPNSTVSRAHAALVFEARSNGFRLIDENSSYGTSLLRDSRLIQVPASGRGLLLQNGDEIYLGQARVRFEAAAAKQG